MENKKIGLKHYLKVFLYGFIAVFLYIYIMFCYITSKKQVIVDKDSEEIIKNKLSHILAIWHGRGITCVFPYIRRFKPTYGIVSKNLDGVIIKIIGFLLRYKTFNGSTGKISTDTLKNIVKTLKIKGSRLIITTDGPVGPRFHVQVGTVQLAIMSNVAIIPATVSFKRGLLAKSWDRYLLPVPFSKVVFIVGKPTLPTDSKNNKREIEEIRKEAEENLQNITWKADEMCGLEKIEPLDTDKRGKKLKIK